MLSELEQRGVQGSQKLCVAGKAFDAVLANPCFCSKLFCNSNNRLFSEMFKFFVIDQSIENVLKNWVS
jgi:hypothetical protein